MNYLSKEQIEDLLRYIGVKKIMSWKNDKIQFTCPIHNESNPSCGINADYSPPEEPDKHYQVFHCFACHAGGSIPWLLYKSLPEQFLNFKEAIKFLTDRYGVEYTYDYDPSTNTIIKRYEEEVEVPKRHTLPKTKLALFKCGKETYQYFFDRGFNKADVKKFMIGRDTDNETVIMPVFFEDNELAGFIGRYVDINRPKNFRYWVYNFEKSSIIYPLNLLKVSYDTIIGVESMLDVIALHKWGYENAVAFMGDGVSKKQADLIADRCRVFIALFDNDAGGRIAEQLAEKYLMGRVNILYPTRYPNYGKDPLEWGKENTIKIIESARLKGSIIPRFDD